MPRYVHRENAWLYGIVGMGSTTTVDAAMVSADIGGRPRFVQREEPSSVTVSGTALSPSSVLVCVRHTLPCLAWTWGE
jgi:hypothetical protein